LAFLWSAVAGLFPAVSISEEKQRGFWGKLRFLVYAILLESRTLQTAESRCQLSAFLQQDAPTWSRRLAALGVSSSPQKANFKPN
jgi:hypothetical protein